MFLFVSIPTSKEVDAEFYTIDLYHLRRKWQNDAKKMSVRKTTIKSMQTHKETVSISCNNLEIEIIWDRLYHAKSIESGECEPGSLKLIWSDDNTFFITTPKALWIPSEGNYKDIPSVCTATVLNVFRD